MCHTFQFRRNLAIINVNNTFSFRIMCCYKQPNAAIFVLKLLGTQSRNTEDLIDISTRFGTPASAQRSDSTVMQQERRLQQKSYFAKVGSLQQA